MAENNHQHTNNHDEITLDIATPRGVYVGDFPKNDKVSDVIGTAIDRKGLDPNERFDLYFNGTALEPQRTLVSYGLEDEVKLELVATGSGV